MEHGSKSKTGGSGKDLVLKVPIGTQIYEEDNNTLIYDFTKIKKILSRFRWQGAG